MIRFVGPLLLAECGPTLLAALRPLTIPGRRFETLLRDLPECLCVVAADPTGILAWATAQPDGVIACYVHPKRRREGIGKALVSAVGEAAAVRWPGVEWISLTKPGSPERKFFEAVWRAA